jgi:hypothetical protein
MEPVTVDDRCSPPVRGEGANDGPLGRVVRQPPVAIAGLGCIEPEARHPPNFEHADALSAALQQFLETW